MTETFRDQYLGNWETPNVVFSREELAVLAPRYTKEYVMFLASLYYERPDSDKVSKPCTDLAEQFEISPHEVFELKQIAAAIIRRGVQ